MILGSFVFATSLTLADLGSTKIALSRGGVEVGAIPNPWIRTPVELSFLLYGDLLVKEKCPKMKWPYRLLTTGAMAYVVQKNLKVKR